MLRPALLLSLVASLALAGCSSPCGRPWWHDWDNDGTMDEWDPDVDGDGYDPAAGDCDDCDPLQGPNLEDTGCDGLDQDCDGRDGPDGDAGAECGEPTDRPAAEERPPVEQPEGSHASATADPPASLGSL